MTDKPTRTTDGAQVFHMVSSRKRNAEELRIQEYEMKIAEHFRAQNEILHANNKEQGERIQRLTVGVERLVAEMHGVRTGTQEQAFARVGGMNCDPDLPTVSAEAALFYTYTAKQIGSELGFHSSQIGMLLGPRGLKWAGNGDYQEIGRSTSPGHSKFWHKDVPSHLRRIFDEGKPEKYGITHGAVLSMFRKWSHKKTAEKMFAEMEPSSPH